MVLAGVIVGLACSRSRKDVGSKADYSTEVRTDWVAAHTGSSKRILVGVERRGEDTQLTFAYQRGVVSPLRLTSLFFGREAAAGDSCSIEATNRSGELLAGVYVLGSSPSNYRVIGCRKKTLEPGDYDLIAETDKGPVRRRVSVKQDLSVEIRYWEE
jgi:hypothetical protein